jgi:hypothetical protein
MKKQIFTIILLLMGGVSAFGQSFKLDATGANDMRLRTSSLDRLTILPTGNVGINTITPDAKLDVNGDLILAPYIYNPSANYTGDPFNRNLRSYMSLNPPTGVTTTIKGIDGGTVDRYGLMLFISCGGIGTVILKHNNSTLAANKINTNTGADIVITGRGGATLVYDTDGWRVLSYDRGVQTQTIVVSPQSFQKRSNPSTGTLTTGAYGNCYIYGVGVTEQLIAPVVIPTGSVITEVTFYYTDNSANANLNMILWGTSVTSLGNSYVANLFQNTINASPLDISNISSGVLNESVTDGEYYYLQITPRNTTNTANYPWENEMSVKGVKITYTL